ncbi:MAG TPA: trypsin-like peptidase domain-containing protein, partial [Patescibacteria group bacterium]|nr:trypsin-like peptidase domain-containing protein [Patescibacteria group bacterium]
MQKEKSQIIETVEKVMPAVVSITITESVGQVEKEFAHIPKKRWARKQLEIPPDKIDAHGMVQIGGGSGFIVHSKGIILTNKHVLAGDGARHTITLSTGESYDGEIVAKDPINDVAIFSIQARNPLPVVPLGNSAALQLGQTVLAFGNALGIFQNTVSAGIIYGLSRSVSAYAD